MFAFEPMPEPPASALISLEENPYGFSLIDLQIPYEDLISFKQIKISKTQDYNHFGDLSGLENEVIEFLTEITSNDSETIKQVAYQIDQIAQEIVEVSGRAKAWVLLRAVVPPTPFDTSRWHMDGHYYRSINPEDLQYKFAMTILGQGTRFWPLPREFIQTRRVIWSNMSDVKFLRELCQTQPEFIVEDGKGAFFIAGDKRKAALHAEPIIKENRLFFSIVPCGRQEIDELEMKVRSSYNQRTPQIKTTRNQSGS